jgi:hypothetical protein
VGNIFGRWEGEESAAVLTGSHCDAIPLAGAYDGTLGVIGAIAAVAALKAAVRPSPQAHRLQLCTYHGASSIGPLCDVISWQAHQGPGTAGCSS